MPLIFLCPHPLFSLRPALAHKIVIALKPGGYGDNFPVGIVKIRDADIIMKLRRKTSRQPLKGQIKFP